MVMQDNMMSAMESTKERNTVFCLGALVQVSHTHTDCTICSAQAMK